MRRRVIVHGHVQGVFFRDTARRIAIGRGVAGSIANRPDGTVEAVFEGPAQAVEALVDFCRRGPEGAVVARVEVSEEETRGVEGFRVM